MAMPNATATTTATARITALRLRTGCRQRTGNARGEHGVAGRVKPLVAPDETERAEFFHADIRRGEHREVTDDGRDENDEEPPEAATTDGIGHSPES